MKRWPERVTWKRVLRMAFAPNARLRTARSSSPRTTGLAAAVQDDEHRSSAAVTLGDRDIAQDLADAGPRVGVQSRDELVPADLVAPRHVRAPGGAVVGEAREVRARRAAPDVGGGTGVAAAVGVKECAGRGAVEPEDLRRRVLAGFDGEPRPARRFQPSGLIELAMRRGAEVVSVALVPADMRRRIRAGDHRLHFEHPLDVRGIARRRGELRQNGSADVFLERNTDRGRIGGDFHADEPRHACHGHRQRLPA